LVSEDDGVDDTSQVTNGTNYARDDTILGGVNVGHKGIVDTVSCLQEDSHDSDETEHGGLVVWVELSNDDE
jgi:hypothetical protein